MRHERCRFASLIILAVAGMSNVFAGQLYLTANGTGTLNYFNWNIPSGIFGYFYDYLDVTPSCPGGSCVAASTPGGTFLGNYGFSIGGNYFFSNFGDGHPAQLDGPSSYYELLVPFPAGGLGSIAMNSPTPGPNLLDGSVTGIGIYGTVSASTATIEIEISNPTSQVLTGLASTVYLDISGTTNGPVGVSPFSGNPAGVYINPFLLDWTATLSDTSLVDAAAPTSAPEPSSLWLVTGGALCLAAFRRFRTN